MFGRNKGAKQTAEAAALMAEVQAGQFEPPSGGVSQGVSYGGEGDPNPMAGLGLGGQTNVEVFGNASPSNSKLRWPRPKKCWAVWRRTVTSRRPDWPIWPTRDACSAAAASQPARPGRHQR